MLDGRIKIFLLLIVAIQSVNSLRVFKPNKNDDIAEKIKEIILKNVYNKQDILPNNPTTKTELNVKDLRKKFLGKSRLVRRIIPHTYKSGKYEYDSKLNTIYKPLIRFHVKRPIKELEQLIPKPKVLGYAILYRKNKSKLKNKKANMKVLRIIDTTNRLRSGNVVSDVLDADKSKEEVDTLAPGNIPVTGSDETHTESTIVIPSFPFWNSWTYAKTIYQDDCEGLTVKLGNVCVFPAGHRRNDDKETVFL